MKLAKLWRRKRPEPESLHVPGALRRNALRAEALAMLDRLVTQHNQFENERDQQCRNF